MEWGSSCLDGNMCFTYDQSPYQRPHYPFIGLHAYQATECLLLKQVCERVSQNLYHLNVRRSLVCFSRLVMIANLTQEHETAAPSGLACTS